MQLIKRSFASVSRGMTNQKGSVPSGQRKVRSLANGQRLWCAGSTRCFASDTSSPFVMKEDSSQIVHSLKESVILPNSREAIPTYQVMDLQGNILNEAENPKLSDETLLKMYTQMVTLSQMDQILYDIQRQGRVSFYMMSLGEEATHFGSAAALDARDVIYAQYREAGVLMWRGFTLDDFANQCFSNSHDYGKGRQMPVHYGSSKLNFQTISSPLATQIPQAAGAAYAMKLAGQKTVSMCYFGEGAASEGDFHAALNFAATLDAPVIFFCRNNKYAISTPSNEQYRGDGIAARGIAYGIYTIRVDGNDIFAVYNATKAAREYALENNAPVVIEAMTYRGSHHSTSDDYTRYRSQAEVDSYLGTNSPIRRLKAHLLKRKLWTEEQDKELFTKAKRDVLTAVKKAEQELKPPLDDLFNDVYDKDTWMIAEQRKELADHMAKYPEYYSTKDYKQ